MTAWPSWLSTEIVVNDYDFCYHITCEDLYRTPFLPFRSVDPALVLSKAGRISIALPNRSLDRSKRGNRRFNDLRSHPTKWYADPFFDLMIGDP